MRAFVVALLLVLVSVSEARRNGADARSWPAMEEHRLGDTSAVSSKASAVTTTTDSSKCTSRTPTATETTSTPAASSTPSSKTGCSPPTIRSSTYTKARSRSSAAADGNCRDHDFWDSPIVIGERFPRHDYDHPRVHA